MKLDVSVKMNLKTEQVAEAVKKAAQLAMRDTVVAIQNEAIRDSPKKTGHNSRSLAAEVSGMGTVAKGADATEERVVDDSQIQGAVYSTSGYGGYLCTGTAKMPARPYIKPAADRNFSEEKFGNRMKQHLGES